MIIIYQLINPKFCSEIKKEIRYDIINPVANPNIKKIIILPAEVIEDIIKNIRTIKNPIISEVGVVISIKKLNSIAKAIPKTNCRD